MIQICEKECQKIRLKEVQKECQKECQKVCQKECQKICQKECQKICQKEFHVVTKSLADLASPFSVRTAKTFVVAGSQPVTGNWPGSVEIKSAFENSGSQEIHLCCCLQGGWLAGRENLQVPTENMRVTCCHQVTC